MKKLIAALGLIIMSAFATVHAAAADFSFSGNAMTMTGTIERGDYIRFLLATIGHEEDIKYLVMTSPGGSFYDALAIGQYVRNNKIITVARASCHSGCAYIWLSSPVKMVDGVVGAYMSIHMPFFVPVPWTHKKYSEPVSVKQAMDYLTMIGLPKEAVEKIGAAQNGENLWLSPTEIHDWGLYVLLYFDADGVKILKKKVEDAVKQQEENAG